MRSGDLYSSDSWCWSIAHAEKDEIRLSSSVEMDNDIFWDVFCCVLQNFHFKSKIENDL